MKKLLFSLLAISFTNSYSAQVDVTTLQFHLDKTICGYMNQDPHTVININNDLIYDFMTADNNWYINDQRAAEDKSFSGVLCTATSYPTPTLPLTLISLIGSDEKYCASKLVIRYAYRSKNGAMEDSTTIYPGRDQSYCYFPGGSSHRGSCYMGISSITLQKQKSDDIYPLMIGIACADDISNIRNYVYFNYT